uniref:GP-PDE domain-containing protein n=1 Tax=Trichuris muris TaxID=70415 RepID=A0A5S6QQW8_TRIMR
MSLTWILIVFVLLLYIAVSIYYTNYPRHGVDPPHYTLLCGKVVCYCGGAGEECENTLGAYGNAVLCGGEAIYCHCQMTKDKKIVLARDNNLLRTAGVDKCISELKFNELPLLKRTIQADYNNELKRNIPRLDDRKIPLLSSCLSQFQYTDLVIHFEQYDEEMVELVYKMIKGRDANVTWGCNSRTENEKLYKKHADINILCPFSQFYLYLMLFFMGLLPHIPIKETVIEVPVPSSFVNNELKNWPYLPSFIKKMLAVIADALVLQPSLFRHLKKRCVLVYPGILNDNESFERYWKAGVSGMITDFPSRLQKFYKSKIKSN